MTVDEVMSMKPGPELAGGDRRMTREEILAMKSGRELDKLVDNIVMNRYSTTGRHGEWIYPAPRSRNIAAAWEVEKRALEIDGLLYVAALMQVIYGDIDKVDYIENIDPDNAIKWCALPALFKATPEQRCKASLLAVMGE